LIFDTAKALGVFIDLFERDVNFADVMQAVKEINYDD